MFKEKVHNYVQSKVSMFKAKSICSKQRSYVQTKVPIFKAKFKCLEQSSLCSKQSLYVQNKLLRDQSITVIFHFSLAAPSLFVLRLQKSFKRKKETKSALRSRVLAGSGSCEQVSFLVCCAVSVSHTRFKKTQVVETHWQNQLLKLRKRHLR